jgi:hypothetical protein
MRKSGDIEIGRRRTARVSRSSGSCDQPVAQARHWGAPPGGRRVVATVINALELNPPERDGDEEVTRAADSWSYEMDPHPCRQSSCSVPLRELRGDARGYARTEQERQRANSMRVWALFGCRQGRSIASRCAG